MTSRSRFHQKLGNRNKEDDKSLVWDSKLEPLMIELLANKGVKLRSGVEVGQKAVEYFRGQDFVKWILKNQTKLCKKFSECFPLSDNAKELTVDDATNLGNELLKKGFIYRADHQPITGVTLKDSNQKSNGVSSPIKSKAPTRLAYSSVQKFDADSLFVLMYEHATSWNYVMLSLILGSVLFVCMFPAWPLALKLLMWYLLVALSTALLAIVVIRLIIFTLIWFLGSDFWIFPNLFAEDLGFFDSFKPLYSFEYRNDNWMMVFARVSLAIVAAGALYQLSKQHSLGDVQRFAKRQFLDVVDWGHQKLSAPPAESSVPVAKHGFAGRHNKKEEIMAEDTKYQCMEACGFESFEVIKEDCIFDCQCMTALIESHCFKKCPQSVKEILTTAQRDACAETTDEKTS